MNSELKLSRAVEKLHEWMRAHSPLIVAFSGGVDSALLLAEAVEALGDDVTAVTGRGPQFPSDETIRAERMGKELGVRHCWMNVSPTDVPELRYNPVDRCYHCKHVIFGNVLKAAKELGVSYVVDGTHLDDAGEYRPGRKALSELGVLSPLALCGFNKEMVRARSRALGLETAELPSCACLVTRIPYGEEVTEERLARIDRAESALQSFAFSQLRVRDHGDLARLELQSEDFGRMLSDCLRAEVCDSVRSAGYKFVTLDLMGYRASNPEDIDNVGSA